MSNRPKNRLIGIGEPIKPYTRARTKLCGIGDEMSELNIQRRLQWWRERNPSGVIKVDQESVDADPALQRAVQELSFLQIRKPRE